MYGFGGAEKRTWESPECVGIGRLPSRSPLLPFPDPEAALAGDRERSPWFQSLNGNWKFTLCSRPEASPDDFFSRDFDDADWSEIPVPSNWTLEGHDRPHYTNVQMPFPEPPPTVPRENPTGLYRRRFQDSGELGGAPGGAPLRRRRERALRLRERAPGGHEQGLAARRRVRRDGLRPAGGERPGGHGDPLVRRHLPRGSGPLVHGWHLPRCLPVLDRADLHRRRLCGRGSRRGVSERLAEGRRQGRLPRHGRRGMADPRPPDRRPGA